MGRTPGTRDYREPLNGPRAFAGLAMPPTGSSTEELPRRKHDEALSRLRRLHDELQRRRGHSQVFKYCTRELVAEDCFGAVFEATKGLAERVRQLTGMDLDRYQMVREAFEVRLHVAFNALRPVTERNEKRGLASIMKGVFSAFRNAEAHEPRLIWHVSEPDALDILTAVSLLHRRLDGAQVLRGHSKAS